MAQDLTNEHFRAAAASWNSGCYGAIAEFHGMEPQALPTAPYWRRTIETILLSRPKMMSSAADSRRRV